MPEPNETRCGTCGHLLWMHTTESLKKACASDDCRCQEFTPSPTPAAQPEPRRWMTNEHYSPHYENQNCSSRHGCLPASQTSTSRPDSTSPAQGDAPCPTCGQAKITAAARERVRLAVERKQFEVTQEKSYSGELERKLAESEREVGELRDLLQEAEIMFGNDLDHGGTGDNRIIGAWLEKAECLLASPQGEGEL